MEEFVIEAILNDDPDTWIVDLSCRGLNDGDMSRLSGALSDNTHVQVLNVSDNEITAEGLNELCLSLSDRNALRELDISDNEVADRGARSVEGLLMRATTLGYVNMARCGLGPKGKRAIEGAVEWYRTHVGTIEVDLAGNDAVVENLSSTRGLSAAAFGSGRGAGGGGVHGHHHHQSNLTKAAQQLPSNRGSTAALLARTGSSGRSKLSSLPAGMARQQFDSGRGLSRKPSGAGGGGGGGGGGGIDLHIEGADGSMGDYSPGPGRWSANVSRDNSAVDLGGDEKLSQLSLQLEHTEAARRRAEREAELAKAKLEGGQNAAYRRIQAADLEVGSKIASGGFAKVYRGAWFGQDVAIKVFKKGKEEATKVAFEKEMHILSNLRHPNCVLMLGGYTDGEGRLAIVTELMRGGSLFDLLRKHNEAGTQLEHAKLKQILKDIAQGCAYLHMCRPRIIHRDLKSLNVLLDDHHRAKVADFGLSREHVDGQTMTVGLGTPHWLPREVMAREKYDHKVDVYSFGMLVWEVATTEIPFDGMDAFSLIGKLLQNKDFRPQIPSYVHKKVAKLIKMCWAHNHKNRPEFRDILKYIDTEL